MSMTENTETETGAAPDAAATKNAKKKKKLWPRELPKGAKKPPKQEKSKADQFEFSGRVESINVKGDGASGSQCVVNLTNKKGQHRSFRLDPADALHFSTMANLIFVAFSAGRKVNLRTAPNADGSGYVSEVEVRAKS